jgi:hypothetical protein
MDADRRAAGGGAMKDILKIIVAIIVIVVVWKIVKGLIGLLVGLVVAGLIVYGAVKLAENVSGPKRLK